MADMIETMARNAYEQQGPSISWADVPPIYRSMWRTWVRGELAHTIALLIVRQAFPQAEIIRGRET